MSVSKENGPAQKKRREDVTFMRDKSEYVKFESVGELHREKNSSLDTVHTTSTPEVMRTNPMTRGRQRLHEADVEAVKTVEDIQALVEGTNAEMLQLGIVISEAQHHLGWEERALDVLGHFGVTSARHKAEALMRTRVHKMDIGELLTHLKETHEYTAKEIEHAEGLCKADIVDYQKTIDELTQIYITENPKFLAAQGKRIQLELELSNAAQAVDSSPEDTRPLRVKELEDKQRQLSSIKEEEKDHFIEVKNAKDGIPKQQLARNAKQQQLDNLHSMRHDMLAKFNSVRTIFGHATTSMKTRISADLYATIDPAMNKAVAAILQNDITTAGAIMEISVERLKQASLDPAKAQELIEQMYKDSAYCIDEINKLEAANTVKTASALLKDESGHLVTMQELIEDSKKEELVPANKGMGSSDEQ